MQNYKKQWNVLEMPLFEPPNHHKRIWQSLPAPTQQAVITLTARLLRQCQGQKNQGGTDHE